MSSNEPLSKEFEWNGYNVALTVEDLGGRYECTSLGLTSTDPCGSVDPAAYRSIPLDRWVRALVAEHAPGPRMIAGDISELVAHVYREAHLRHEPPKLTVAKTFNVSPATASRMIRRARDAGLSLPTAKTGRPVSVVEIGDVA